MKIDLERLAKFIVNAKKIEYNLELQPGTLLEDNHGKEFDHQDEEFLYMHRPLGRFSGIEEVSRGANADSPTIWALQYHGNMIGIFSESQDKANIGYKILQRALQHVPENLPLRGPPRYILPAGDSSWVYVNDLEGGIMQFKGHEKIFFEGSKVYHGDYIGGLVT